MLPGCGPYRFTATVGEGGLPAPEVPEAVQEAWRRLHEYSRGIAEQFREEASHVREEETETISGWIRNATLISHAPELLCPPRRAYCSADLEPSSDARTQLIRANQPPASPR